MSVLIGLSLLSLLGSEPGILMAMPAHGIRAVTSINASTDNVSIEVLEPNKQIDRRSSISRESTDSLTQQALDNPSDTLTLNRLAAGLFDQGQFEEAERLYRHIIRLTPEDPLAYYDLGLALVAQDRYEEAIDAMQTVIRWAPDDSFAHFELGQMQHQQGQFAQAEAAFRTVIRLDPDDALAYDRLSQTLASQGRPEESAIAAQTASELDRENIFCLRDPDSCDPSDNPFRRPSSL